MKLAVVALPRLSERDRLWIETIRQRHDPRHGRIGPHVTLVFPQPCAGPGTLIRHVEAVAGRHEPFSVRMRTALAFEDPAGRAAHVYLVPDEGRPEIVGLHKELYEGIPASALDPHIPYIPHVTVAAMPDGAAARAVADGLNARTFEVASGIGTLTVVRCDRADLQVLARIGLGRSRAS
jgi:2'-5' RNA ligase